MDTVKIIKTIELIRDCSVRQNEIYRILGKHLFRNDIEDDLRRAADEYQKTIDKETKKIREHLL